MDNSFNKILFLTSFCCMAIDGEIASEEYSLLKEMSKQKIFGNIDIITDYNRCIEVLKQDGRNFINSYFQSIDNIQFEEDEKLRIIDVAVKTIYADNKIEYAEVKFFKSLCQHLSVDKDIIVKNNPDVDEYWLEEDILSQEDNDKFMDLIDFSNINYEKSNS